MKDQILSYKDLETFAQSLTGIVLNWRVTISRFTLPDRMDETFSALLSQRFAYIA